VPEFVDLARKYDAAIVFADSEKYPAIADPTSDFIYARLQKTESGVKTGYAPAALKKWAEHAQEWEKGAVPKDLPAFGPAPQKKKRDVFMFMISGAKEKNPAAAMAFLKLVK